MTNAVQEDWFAHAIGRAMNLDGVAGLQCVDVPNDYAQNLFGNWEQTIGRGNAKDKYDIAPDEYWEKFPNNPSDPNQLPQRGDVIVWPAMTKIENPAGHIAVVLSATDQTVTVIEQDGFYPTKPAFEATHPYLLQGVLPIGWLRPRQEKIIGGTLEVTIEDYARDILDVIEDKPHYEEDQKEAFDGHVAWLKANPAWDKRREWVKGIMANNHVLNATLMRQHLATDAQVESELSVAQQAKAQVDQTLENQEKQANQQISDLTSASKQKDDIILALQKQIDDLKKQKPVEAPKSDETPKKVSAVIQNLLNILVLALKGVKK